MSDTTTAERGPGKSPSEKRGLFARIGLFYRQVVAELRKVVWPTRRELITYTSVVLVFVIIMMVIIGIEDVVFGRLAITIFGD